jgi:hypothetical protein
MRKLVCLEIASRAMHNPSCTRPGTALPFPLSPLASPARSKDGLSNIDHHKEPFSFQTNVNQDGLTITRSLCAVQLVVITVRQLRLQWCHRAIKLGFAFGQFAQCQLFPLSLASACSSPTSRVSSHGVSRRDQPGPRFPSTGDFSQQQDRPHALPHPVPGAPTPRPLWSQLSQSHQRVRGRQCLGQGRYSVQALPPPHAPLDSSRSHEEG